MTFILFDLVYNKNAPCHFWFYVIVLHLFDKLIKLIPWLNLRDSIFRLFEILKSSDVKVHNISGVLRRRLYLVCDHFFYFIHGVMFVFRVDRLSKIEVKMGIIRSEVR